MFHCLMFNQQTILLALFFSAAAMALSATFFFTTIRVVRLLSAQHLITVVEPTNHYHDHFNQCVCEKCCWSTLLIKSYENE